MALSYIIPVTVLVGVVFTQTGCAATGTYSQGESTTVVIQGGNGSQRSTQVTQTPHGQKIISRSGGNLDISVQSNGASKDDGDQEDECVARGKGFFSSMGEMFWGKANCEKSSIRGKDIPTSSEYKERMMDRMRPVGPKR
ncbi:conserved exported hypothetical protein [Gammaproteobacteria bacterium]